MYGDVVVIVCVDVYEVMNLVCVVFVEFFGKFIGGDEIVFVCVEVDELV